MSITSYNKKFGILNMILLPVIIVLLLLLIGFEADAENPIACLAAVLWILFFFNALLVSWGGFSLYKGFNEQVQHFEKRGFPIQSLSGFPETKSSVAKVFSSSFFISIVVFFSLVNYLVLLFGKPLLDEIFTGEGETPITTADLIPIVQAVAIGLTLIAIGIALLLKLPKKPALKPGSLMTYFYPSAIPSAIDNFLADSIVAFLDPVTRLRWDEWTKCIAENLSDHFNPDDDLQDRIDSAREKVLLFAYLHQKIPETMTMEVVRSELGELFKDERGLQSVLNGEGSEITWDILSEIFDDVMDEAPEIFEVVDRLLVELTDNVESFKKSDLWVTTTHPTTVGGNTKPFRILVFMVNQNKDFSAKKRPVKVVINSEDSLQPVKYTIHLDEAELEIKSNKLPLISENEEDIVGVMTKLLQQGDAVWFQFYRRNFYPYIFNVSIEEEDKGAIYGTSIQIKLVRDFKFYISAYGGKLSAVAGLALPVLRGLIGM